MTDKMAESVSIECDCGWIGEFKSTQAGMQIECPECGKIHRVPTFSGKVESVDMATLNRLLGRENTPSVATTVTFAPIFKLACAVGAVLFLVGILLVPGSLPVKAGVAGIGLGWPFGMGWAWLSQRRYLKKRAASL
ncbi:MAG: hypothetical protein L3J82_05230 [Planctomycetes bacterium]|nr:hypothetical protein [Planctomycetota bacterium]